MLNIIPMVVTKKMAKEYTKKKEREFKHFTTKKLTEKQKTGMQKNEGQKNL